MANSHCYRLGENLEKIFKNNTALRKPEHYLSRIVLPPRRAAWIAAAVTPVPPATTKISDV
ncbi:hypothetical protein [Nostoc sp.]|uniref:hypothetical protein n=1 Tax=Nostoc sp. TaxID=1180 RepID=UPI002FF7E150